MALSSRDVHLTAPGQMAFRIGYVDFLPAMLDAGGIFSSPTFERFDALVEQANAWLSKNPHAKVKTCESVEVKLKSNSCIDPQKSTFWEYGNKMMFFVRYLRLWVVPKDAGDPPHPQQIGYLNVVPACTSSGGVFSDPKFETFGQTIEKVNQMLKQQPLQGRILNIETQDMKFHSWDESVDPDKSNWRESGKQITYFLNVIRLFYEGGPPGLEEIGCVDFVPNCLQPSGVFSHSAYETLGVVAQKAQAWIQQQQGINITNVQTIDYKVSHTWSAGETIDSHRTLFREYGKRRTYYLRIMRVCYTRPFAPGGMIPSQNPVLFSYKTFSPAPLTVGGIMSIPQYETVSENMQRVIAWINATGVKVLSVETVPVRMYSGNQYGSSEMTYTYNSGERSEHWLLVIRIFLDGYYQEPPPEALPPLPQIQQDSSDCCSIL